MVKPESDTRKLLMQLVAGDQAVPGGGAGFRGIGRRAFLLLEAQGTVVFDDMYIIKTIAKFDNLTMLGSVGWDIGTVSKFARRLNKVIFLIPNPQQGK